ncbi:hypothetical protein ACHQM5_002389 [Ranunculus cassubicifolius]
MEGREQNLILKEQMCSIKLDEARKELTGLKAKLNEMEGREQNLILKEQMCSSKLNEAHKELTSLKAKLDEMEGREQNLILKDQMRSNKLDEAHKELTSLKAKLDEMEGREQNLMLKEQMCGIKLDEAHKELISLKTQMRALKGNVDVLTKHLETKRDDMQYVESLNNVLVVKELKTNDEIQESRKKLTTGFQKLIRDHSTIGIKRMGELNPKPFRDVCMKKFATEDWDTKSAELCSLWQERIKDSLWFPFKVVQSKSGEYVEIIDDKDNELKQLKNELGEQVYKAVCCALSEINEYNPSSRYAEPVLWNMKEDRKARLEEAIECVLEQMVILKRTRNRGRYA